MLYHLINPAGHNKCKPVFSKTETIKHKTEAKASTTEGTEKAQRVSRKGAKTQRKKGKRQKAKNRGKSISTGKSVNHRGRRESLHTVFWHLDFVI